MTQATGLVRTVLGDVDGRSLGRTDYHEHLFQVSPLLPGDELDDEERSAAEAGLLHRAGIDAMIDATPIGLGRDPAAVARISARTGLAVVATTGTHQERHYPSDGWLLGLDEQELTRRFAREVRDGLPVRDVPGTTTDARTPDGEPVRAGVVKAGIGYWSITAFERRVLAAVAAAHRVTGAPVMVHTEHGSAGFEVLDLLAAGGVPADAVVLAHVDRNPDPGLHAELASAGAYLGYDGPARGRSHPDSTVLACLVDTAARGGLDRILLGGDVARRTRYTSYGGMPGLAYLPERFVPRLEREAGAGVTRAVLVDNPARFLTRVYR